MKEDFPLLEFPRLNEREMVHVKLLKSRRGRSISATELKGDSRRQEGLEGR